MLTYRTPRFRAALAVYAAVCAATAASVGVVPALLPPLAAYAAGQSLSTWKTITVKEAGVSVLMPPGTTSKPDVTVDKDTGAKIVMVTLENESKKSKTMNMFMALRVNKAGLDAMRAEAPAGKEPMDYLYDTYLKPSLDELMQLGDEPDKGTVTRKPLVWHGMNGEEITLQARGTKRRPGGFMRFRTIKNKNSFYCLMAAEEKHTANSDIRMARFFDSFKIAPGNPFGERNEDAAPPAPIPTPQPVPPPAAAAVQP